MDDKQKRLHELLEELERQKKTENRYDIVVPTDQLKVTVDVGTNKILMEVPQPSGDSKYHAITDFCHEQIADKCGIPRKYYQRMLEDDKLDLLKENINEWISSKEKRLIRVLDGKVRALLSDRYRCIDNYDIFESALEEFKNIQKNKGLDIQIIDAKLTETNLYIKVTSPQLTAMIKHWRGSEEQVEGGVIITNSEVGRGAFTVKPYINVLVCTNGLISSTILKRVHLGEKKELGIIDWSDETKQLQDATLWSQIKDMINHTFDLEVFKQWIDEINQKATTEILKPKLAVDNIVKRFSTIPKGAVDDLLNQFTRERPTQWGLAMAVTRVAQDQADYNKQVEWEKVGAEILELPIKAIVKEEKEE